MKYIKRFDKKEKPKVGDYVLVKENLKNNPDLYKIIDFTSNNIGEIIFGKHLADDEITYDYKVKYNNVPHLLIPYFGEYYDRPMRRSEIVEWSENKIDLEIFLDAKKYNL